MTRNEQKSAIEYGFSEDAWNGFEPQLRDLVRKFPIRSICEIGGGANPALPIDFVQAQQLDYIIMDVSADELAKAPPGYRTRVQNATAPLSGEQGTYDMVFSKMLAEHVGDAEAFHRNVFALLCPGGIAFHFFPTLYAPPYLFNWIMPEWLTSAIVSVMQHGREKSGRTGKFPAYYDWCRGPSPGQLARFESVGFKVVRYVGFFGHPGYCQKVPAIRRLHVRLSRWLCQHPTPWLTSFAYVIVQKPGE